MAGRLIGFREHRVGGLRHRSITTFFPRQSPPSHKNSTPVVEPGQSDFVAFFDGSPRSGWRMRGSSIPSMVNLRLGSNIRRHALISDWTESVSSRLRISERLLYRSAAIVETRSPTRSWDTMSRAWRIG